MQKTGRLEHGEDPASPYYTPEGNWAGANAVLSAGGSWANGNPWEWAPLHLAQLLAPQLSVTGVADRNGLICMITEAGYRRPFSSGTPAVVTYPGNGTRGIYAEETAAETPFTPGQLFGLAQGTTTGPYLYVFVWGGAVGTLVAAHLQGPEGSVPVEFVGSCR